jgi:hypothetical protein
VSSRPNRFTLLLGSPKTRRSSAASFGEYLLSKAGKGKPVRETHHAGKAVRSDEAWEEMVGSLDSADVILLTFPLYWDSLPSHLVECLERLHDRGVRNSPRKTFYAVVHNGFPEPWHNEVAVLICEQFCRQMGFTWGGALNIGGGAAVSGRPMEETGGMTLRLRETLDMAADSVSVGEPIPATVLNRLEKPLYPPFFARFFGGFGWRKGAKRRGVKVSLKARPYDEGKWQDDRTARL